MRSMEKTQIQGPYKTKGANAAYQRGRQARRDHVNCCKNPEKHFVSAWSNGWDSENSELNKAAWAARQAAARVRCVLRGETEPSDAMIDATEGSN